VSIFFLEGHERLTLDAEAQRRFAAMQKLIELLSMNATSLHHL